MESFFTVFAGEKFVTETKIPLRKGQKIIVTVLEAEIPAGEEADY